MSKVAHFSLKNCDDKIDLKVEQLSSGDVGIRIWGHGEMTSKDGDGMPVLLTRDCDGEVQVAIWSDINQEDATDVINMNGALESNRDGGILTEPVKEAVKFTKEEQVTIHEVARMGLAMVFDEIGEELDLSDEFLKNLQEKLQKEGENG